MREQPAAHTLARPLTEALSDSLRDTPVPDQFGEEDECGWFVDAGDQHLFELQRPTARLLRSVHN